MYFHSFYLYICNTQTHAGTHTPTYTFLSKEPLGQRMRMKERLHFSFKYACRFCSNLMTQDLARFLNLLLQNFILILNKCSHTGTENKTGKCCLSYPLCCYYMAFKCTDCSVLPMQVIVLLLLFLNLEFSLVALHTKEEHISCMDIYFWY